MELNHVPLTRSITECSTARFERIFMHRVLHLDELSPKGLNLESAYYWSGRGLWMSRKRGSMKNEMPSCSGHSHLRNWTPAMLPVWLDASRTPLLRVAMQSQYPQRILVIVKWSAYCGLEIWQTDCYPRTRTLTPNLLGCYQHSNTIWEGK